jgi:hypothetical protein
MIQPFNQPMLPLLEVLLSLLASVCIFLKMLSNHLVVIGQGGRSTLNQQFLGSSESQVPCHDVEAWNGMLKGN